MSKIVCAGFVKDRKNAGELTALGFDVGEGGSGALHIKFKKPVGSNPPVVLITSAVPGAPFVQHVSAAEFFVGNPTTAFSFAVIDA